MKNFIATLGFASVSFVSCVNSDCNNTNPIFDANVPQSQEYITELAQRLERADKSKTSYWFNSYEVANGQDYINVDVSADSLCAVAHIKVVEWDDNLADIKKSEGKGYSGTQLKNLQIEVAKDSAGTAFIYKSVDEISD